MGTEKIKFKGKIQNWTCKECENDMRVDMYTRSPYVGALIRCDGCDREIDLVGEQEEVKI